MITERATWRRSEHFVLRLAGFSFELCGGLRFVDATASADALTLLKLRLADIRGRLLGRGCEFFPEAGGFPTKLPAVQTPHGQSPDLLAEYEGLCVQIALCEANLSRSFERESLGARTSLWRIAKREDFQEAIFLSSPEAFKRISAYATTKELRLPNSKVRRVERLTLTYLQRLCTKNDSTSFFGPTRYGVFRPGGPLIYGTPTGRISKRRFFFSHWAAHEIAKSVCASDRNEGESSSTSIPSVTWAPLDHIDCASAPATDRTALHHLKESLTRLAEVNDLNTKREIVDVMNGTFKRLTKLEAFRNTGATYGDRQIFYDDCECDTDLSVSADLVAAFLSSCSELLDAAILPAEARFHALRREFHDWLAAAIGIGNCQPLSVIQKKLKADKQAIATMAKRSHEAMLKACSQLQTNLSRILMSSSDSAESIRLTPEARSTIAKASDQNLPRGGWPCLLSPDVLIAAKSISAINHGDFKLVLGEVHPSMSVNSYYSSLYSNRDLLQADMEELLARTAAGFLPVNVLCPTVNKTFVYTDLHFPDIDLGGIAGPNKTLFRLSDLAVKCDRRDTFLVARGVDQPLFIYNKIPQLLHWLPLSLFTYPFISTESLWKLWFAGRTYAPRVESGATVFFRRTWTFGASELLEAFRSGSSTRQFVLLRDWWTAKQMPRHVFVRIPGEPKPIYIDSESWPFLELLCHRTSNSRKDDSIKITEMMPGPDQLWFADGSGFRTIEIRFTLTRV